METTSYGCAHGTRDASDCNARFHRSNDFRLHGGDGRNDHGWLHVVQLFPQQPLQILQVSFQIALDKRVHKNNNQYPYNLMLRLNCVR